MTWAVIADAPSPTNDRAQMGKSFIRRSPSLEKPNWQGRTITLAEMRRDSTVNRGGGGRFGWQPGDRTPLPFTQGSLQSAPRNPYQSAIAATVMVGQQPQPTAAYSREQNQLSNSHWYYGDSDAPDPAGDLRRTSNQWSDVPFLCMSAGASPSARLAKPASITAAL